MVCPSKQPFFLALRRSRSRLPESRTESGEDRPIDRERGTGWVEKDGGRKWAAWWILAFRRRRSLAPLLPRGSTWYAFCSPALDSAAPRLDLSLPFPCLDYCPFSVFLDPCLHLDASKIHLFGCSMISLRWELDWRNGWC